MGDTLLVSCKSCEQEFPSEVQIHASVIQHNAGLLEGNTYKCPHCSESAVYAKADHRFASIK